RVGRYSVHGAAWAGCPCPGRPDPLISAGPGNRVPRLAGKKGPAVTVTVRELAEWVRGEVLGDGELPISNARTLAEAQPGDITFVEDDKHLPAWQSSRASAAVVPTTVPVNGRPLIRVPDPLMAFARIVQHLRGRPPVGTGSIDPTAHVHP